MGKEYEREITVMGSVPSLGPVLLFDDMEDLFKWGESGTGGDTVFEKLGTLAYNGSACLHMKTRTTGASGGDTVTGERYLFQRPGKRYKYEVLWYLPTLTNVRNVLFYVLVSDGTVTHNVMVFFSVTNSKWQYMDSGGSSQDVPGAGQVLQHSCWHRFLVEFDELKGEYTRLVSDGLEIDMSGIGYQQPSTPGPRSLRVQVGVVTNAAAAVEAHFDDILLMEI